MPKKQKAPTKTPEAPKPDADDIYEQSLGYLHQQIKLVIAGKGTKTKHDPAYRVATLTRMVAQVDAERRKARAQDEKKLEKITLPLVLAWLRQAREEEKRSITRELVAMGQEGNLLA